MFIVLVIVITILMLIALIYLPFIVILRNNKNNEYQLNKGKLNKNLEWLKKSFNGETKEGYQLFFINKDDVTDVKLLYELLSAKKAVETNNINDNYDSVSFDPQDKYLEYQITPYNNLNAYDDAGYNFGIYDRLGDEKYKIKKSCEKFMNESNFNDEGDLVSYYKAIIAAKKINEEEVKKIAKTYFNMVNQLARLKSVSRSKTVNEAINKVHTTQGFDQSQLKRELKELTGD